MRRRRTRHRDFPSAHVDGHEFVGEIAARGVSYRRAGEGLSYFHP